MHLRQQLRPFLAVSTLMAVAAVAGCTGVLGADEAPERSGEAPGALVDPEGNDPFENPISFACDPDEKPRGAILRRLTKRQYENTLFDLFEAALGSSESAEQVYGELSSTLTLIPEDDREVLVDDELLHTFRRLDQSVQQSHVDYWYETGVLAGSVLSRDRLVELVGDCAAEDAGDWESCLRDFVADFGALALRRPLTGDEVEFYAEFYEPSTGIDPLGFSDVIGGLLNAPQFLYQVEHAEEAVSTPAETFELASYELASRLSYHFWGTMPDARLFELASSGALLESATYEAEVERLFSDPRTRTTLREFFREWLKLEDLPPLDMNNGAAVFENFAGDSLPSPELRQDMIEEVVELLDYFTWQEPGGIEQLFLTNYSFARSEELARIYGVAPWDGESEPPSLEAERAGLLTRAAFLATGTANTRPIMKGLFIRTEILCDKIGAPPENAMADPPELSSELSTREVVEQLTETDNGCAYCHAGQINPLGFATEGFDSLGRARSEQLLFDEDGNSAGTATLDTTSVPEVRPGDEDASSGPADLMGLIVDSGKATSCAARHYFRFSFGRHEGVVTDACALESIRTALSDSGSFAGMLRSVALTPEFRRRTFHFELPQVGGEN